MKHLLLHWQQRWRMPELRLLLLALMVSVTVVTTVGFFTSRVENAMQAQARQLLGGDLVLSSARPLDQTYLQRAQQLGLATAETITFPSMVSGGDKLQLSQLKVVSRTYPLQGELKTAVVPGAAEQVVSGQLPASGEIWAEARLFAELGVQPGAQVQLGKSTFTLARVLTQEPDRSSNLFQLAPVVLMNLEDLPATGLLTPASRASFNQLFAGEGNAVKQLKTALTPLLKPTERIRTLDEDLSSVQQTLQRSGRFLGLATLLSVVLAGAAVVLTSTSLMRRELPGVAVLKAMGMSRRQVLQDQAFSLLLTALLAAVIGIGLGLLLQFVLAAWLSQFVGKDLPAPSLLPALNGLLTAVVLLLGFALPQLLRLVDTSPMQILQGALQRPRQSVWVMLASLLLAVFGLLWLQASDLKLAAMLLAGLLVGIGLFWALARLALRLMQTLGRKWQSRWLPSLGRSRRAVLLVVVFATGLFSLLLLTTVRTDLLDRWQEALPADAPDHFLINIQPTEVNALEQFFAERKIKTRLYPMVRGRLVAVNGQPLDPDKFENPRAQRLAEREFNLSSFAELPVSNALLQGQWFERGVTGFSIEKGIGETLGFGMGDQLTFDIAGQRLTDTVSSVREVRWDSMQPNFFVIAAPGSLGEMPSTFITSIHLGEQKLLVTELIRQFPSVTAIDVGAIVGQVRSLVGQVSMAVQGIFVFTLIAGVVVLVAALQSQKAERRREIAILKSLGAGRAELQRRIWGEFLLLGGLAGLLAGLLALTAGNLFGYYLFDLDLKLNLLPLLIGGVAGSVLVGVTGYWNLRGLLDVPPMSLLKA
ncbi:MAG TPA: FtsX-like permease family protein [Candidatus Thiothrix moscowensis]|uniref:ABC transporter permease n=1 Tax=unclassified Thiothrix TaxID=2636184 RepID=UPI0025F39F19|nr:MULTISPECIES: FtsX-like permease family protein [unclassified Thiothrix]HRJ52549.1 FtsX-like permease family protein [Candidatus Thiothrix moscowensis]HRJ94307.1 FtsX-like permease family protein [Candidatus Thiothrix moscowensis]